MIRANLWFDSDAEESRLRFTDCHRLGAPRHGDGSSDGTTARVEKPGADREATIKVYREKRRSEPLSEESVDDEGPGEDQQVTTVNIRCRKAREDRHGGKIRCRGGYVECQRGAGLSKAMSAGAGADLSGRRVLRARSARRRGRLLAVSSRPPAGTKRTAAGCPERFRAPAVRRSAAHRRRPE